MTTQLSPDTTSSWLSVRLWLRLASVLASGAAVGLYTVGNNREADAIFDANGDAGLWSLGVVVVGLAVIPGALLVLVASVQPRAGWAIAPAILGGLWAVAVTVWFGLVVYPPSSTTTDGRRLDPGAIGNVSDLYLAALVCLGLSALTALITCTPNRFRTRPGTPAGPAQ